jgi:hypothetical protein
MYALFGADSYWLVFAAVSLSNKGFGYFFYHT